MNPIRPTHRRPPLRTPLRRPRRADRLTEGRLGPHTESLEPRVLLDGGPAGVTPTDVVFDWDVPPVEVVIDEWLQPPGSLAQETRFVGDGGDQGVINWLGECETYALSLGMGQTLTVRGRPESYGLDLVLAIRSPDGSVVTADETGPDERERLALFHPSETGTYTLGVTSRSGVGRYSLTFFRNMAWELETLYGVANDSIATAEPLDAAFGPLAGSGERAMVRGELSLDAATVIDSEGLESGGLGAAWTSWSSTADGHVEVLPAGNPPEGDYALKLYRDNSSDVSTLMEATWTVDIPAGAEAVLSFKGYLDHGDDAFRGDFVGHANADGIAMSDDGVTWHPIWAGRSWSYSNWPQFTVDLKAAAAEAGMALGPGTQIRFQCYADDWRDEYFLLDDIRLVTSAEDWYSFEMAEGDVVTLATAEDYSGYPAIKADIGLYDGDGHLLTASLDVTGDHRDVEAAILDYRAPAAGRYFARMTGIQENDGYHLVVTRNAGFRVTRSPYTAHQRMSHSGVMLNWVWGVNNPLDYYLLPVNAGDTITLTTNTPLDASAGGDNDCDPLIHLIRPDGWPIAQDDNGAPDGRNARLEHTATTTGVYMVVVTPISGTQGPCVLQATGATGVFPFEVSNAGVADGAALEAAPTELNVWFSSSVLLTSLDAADFTLDGIPAVGVRVVDGKRVIFEMPTGLGEGPHTFAIAAGAMEGIGGNAIEAWSSTFALDMTPPRVVSSSLQEGDVLGLGGFTYVARFDEPLRETNLLADGYALVDRFGVEHAPVSASYDSATSTLTLEFPSLPEETYTLTIFGANGAAEDLAGNDLDGEATAFPVPPNVSGDGVAGGDFVVHFSIETPAVPWPEPLVAWGPAASMIYTSSTQAAIDPGDTDGFRLALDAGQSLTVVLEPDLPLRARVSLLGPAGVPVASAAGAAPGDSAVVQTYQVATAGEYTIVIAAEDGTTGSYLVNLTLNAAVEIEGLGGPANDTAATAQSLDDAFVDLGGGASRAAVTGRNSIIYTQDFESGEFSPAWSMYPEDGSKVSADGYSAVDGKLAMRVGGTLGEGYAAEATVAIDLRGMAPDKLRFYYRDLYTVALPFAGDFEGHVDATGVAVSDDGFHWHPVLDLAVPFDIWTYHQVDLAHEIAESGMTVGDTLYVRFQTYGGSFGYFDALMLTAETEDWYGVDMVAGETFTFALDDPAGGDTNLALYDQAGDVVAIGSATSGDYGVMIADFAVPATGRHYVRTVADFDYSLLVTRNATIDADDDTGLADLAQDIGATGAVIGAGTFPPPPITTETEPNQNNAGEYAEDSFPFANDLSNSFVDAGDGTFQAVVTGQGSSGDFPNAYDFFRVSLRSDDMLSVRLDGPTVRIRFYDDDGDYLGGNYGSKTTTAYLSDHSGDLYIAIRSIPDHSGSDYTLTATLTTPKPFISNYEGYFTIEANAGDALTLETTTPADGPFEFANDLDLLVELYDPSGALVATDDNGAADGRNAALTHVAQQSGTYTVCVLPAAGSGQYVLHVSGYTGAAETFTVTDVDPADGAEMIEAPERMTVTFSEPVGFWSLSPSDLTVDGIAATGVEAIEPRTAVFDLPAGLTDGLHTVAIGAGAVQALPGTPLEPFTSQLSLDLIPPTVIASSLTEGDRLLPGDLAVTIRFSEELDMTDLIDDAFRLTGLVTGGVLPAAWDYVPETSTLTIEYASLGEDSYTLLLHGGGRLTDLFGKTLDGEALAWPIPPGGSGDGTAGGDWVVHFAADPGLLGTLGGTWERVGPNGSLIHVNQATATIGWDGDVDAYPVELDPGQTISLAVHPHGGLQPRVYLVGPTNQIIQAVDAAAPGLDAVVQSAPVVIGGTYVAVVESVGASAGAYDLAAMLNAAFESESHDGAANDVPADAQDLDAGFMALAGNGEYAAVWGSLVAPTGEIVAPEDFEWVDAFPGAGWSTYAMGSGRVEVYNYYGYRLRLKYDDSDTAGYSEAVWSVNLAGAAGATLTFTQEAGHAWDDEPFDGPFTGRYFTDGIAISNDGEHWYPAWQPDKRYYSGGHTYTLDLGAAAADAGIALGPEFRIKFQEYGDGEDDRDAVYRDVVLETPVAPSPLFHEDFESGTLSPAWTTWSSDPSGQVYLSDTYGTAGGALALVMEAPTQEEHVLNEAVWTVDLTDHTQTRLNFAYADYGFHSGSSGDFTGHDGGTCVAISVDGQNWHGIWRAPMQPDGVWGRFTIDLAAEAAEHGIPLGGSLQIKFQAYGLYKMNYDSMFDQFVWDDISITTGEDAYLFQLDAGESASVSLRKTNAEVPVDLAIADASGLLLAVGMTGATGDERIGNFVAPEAGMYYVVVSSYDATEYALVVTRGADQDAEPNGNDNLDDLASAQDITSSGSALGRLRRPMDQLYGFDIVTDEALIIDPANGDVLVRHPLPWRDYAVESGLAATRWSLIFGGDNTLIEIDSQTGEVIRTFGYYGNEPTCAAYLNGEIFVSTGWDMRVVDYVTGALKRSLVVEEMDDGYALTASGSTLYGAAGNVVYEIDPATGDATPIGELSLCDYVSGMAILGDELLVSGTEHLGMYLWADRIMVYDLDTLVWKRTIADYNLYALGGDGGLSPHDYYSVQASAADVLAISTATPADGLRAFGNDLDPAIELYAPAGTLLAADDNGRGDGRNAALTYTAGESGTYVVRVYSISGSGSYVLNVDGHTGPPAPFEVAGIDPPDGTVSDHVPQQIVVEFAEPVLRASVDAADLRVDGIPAVAATLLSPSTIAFVLPAGVGNGLHEVTIPAGAILDLQRTGGSMFTSAFTADLLAPRIVSSSVQQDEVLPTGDRVITVRFDEPLDEGELGEEDFSLTSVHYGAFAPVAWSYDPADSTLTLEYVDLPEDHYALTLRSGEDALKDRVGRSLDGEALAWPIGPAVSGDGEAGGDFVVDFRTDVQTAEFPSLRRVQPAGALIYARAAAGEITAPGNVDAYSVSLEADQRLSLVVRSARTLQPKVSLIAPDSAVIAAATAGAAGEEAVLNVVGLGAAGTYVIRVEGAGGTFGTYSVEATLNASVETETTDGAGNDALATAQDLAPSAVAFAAGADRLAVLGNLGVAAAAYFEAGRLGPDWTAIVEGPDGFLGVCSDGRGIWGHGSLEMWPSVQPPSGDYTSRDAIWELDLAGLDDTELTFWTKVSGRSAQISISNDLTTWHTVWLPGAQTPLWTVHTIQLADEVATAGLELGPALYVKLHQRSKGYNGDSWDNVIVTVEDPADYYRFDLESGQAATIGLESLMDGAVNVELLDAAGTVLAVGTRDATSPDAVIADYVATAAGTYFVRVTGDRGAEYSLVVTREATFDAEPNNNTWRYEPQDLGVTQTVLGSAGTSKTTRLFGVMRDYQGMMSGVELHPLTGALVADIPLPDDLDRSNDVGVALADGSLLVGGPSNRPIYEFELGTWRVLRALPNLGCSVRSLTVLADEIFVTSGSSGAFEDAVVVLDYDTGEVIRTFVLDDPARPVGTDGTTLYAAYQDLLYEMDPATGETVELGGIPGSTIWSVHNDEILAFDDAWPYRMVVFDLHTYQLKREMGWREDLIALSSSEMSTDDYYTFHAQASDALAITTTTPGDAPGQFLNGLDPFVELYAPAGALVATDDNGAADGRNVQLSYSAPVGGTYTVRLAAVPGSRGEYVMQISGHTGAKPFAVDRTDPADGTEALHGPQQMTVEFPAPILLPSLAASDLTVGGLPATGYAVIDGNTVIFDLPVLTEAVHDVSLTAGSILSAAGEPLDAYSGRLAVRVFEYPTPLAAIPPFGGAAYEGPQVTGRIPSAGDTSSHTLVLGAEQMLTVVVDPEVALRATVELSDPAGVLVHSATAGAAGQAVVIQNADVNTTGEYTVTIRGADGTAGEYTVQWTLNAAIETEYHTRLSNNDILDSQDIDNSFLDLGDGSQRAVVTGTIFAHPGAVLGSEGFESGSLGDGWTTYSSYPSSRIEITDEYGAGEGQFALVMDATSRQYTVSEATWTIDLPSSGQVLLTFRHRAWEDTRDFFSGTFTGHYPADGIAISVDGLNWIPIWDAPYHLADWEPYVIDLAVVAAEAGIVLGPDSRIRFQQCGSPPIPDGGRAWDAIAISGDEDWYSFTLDAGQAATLVLSSDGATAADMELYGPDGSLLATGGPGPFSPIEVAEIFVPEGTLLEPRAAITGPDGNLYVTDCDRHSVLRYDGQTGAYIDDFVPNRSGGLFEPWRSTFGPDGNLYVVSHHNGKVLRYDGWTGEFIDEVPSEGYAPSDLTFGPDGYLYGSSDFRDRIIRHDPLTGEQIDEFVTFNSGGLNNPKGITFGPDGHFYVASFGSREILRYDGATGKFIDVFVSRNQGYERPMDVAFGPDGNLYVAYHGSRNVSCFDGRTGEFMGVVAPSNTPGLGQPWGISFGADDALYIVGERSEAVVRSDLRLLAAPDATIAGISASVAGTYSVRVVSNQHYSLLVTRGGTFAAEMNNGPGEASEITVGTPVLGGLGDGGFNGDDWFTVDLDAYGIIEVSTRTPGSGPHGLGNELDPIAELYDPSGVLVARDDNSGADGRNAWLRRVVPIQPKLYTQLLQAFQSATEGEERVCPISRYCLWRNFQTIRRRAGLEKWKDAFQVMRRNCETDWAQEYPQYAVSCWIGHDIRVSARHYLQIPQELYDRATAAKSVQTATKTATKRTNAQIPRDSQKQNP